MLVFDNDERFWNHPVKFVGRGDHRRFQHARMLEQHAFDFGSGDIDAATDDHVVVTALIMKESIGITNENIAWYIPAPPDVLLLMFRQMQVAASRRALDRNKARLAIRQR